MRDWNVIVTVSEHGFKKARQLLASYGEIASTNFYNVLIMKTGDISGFLEDIEKEISADARFAEVISRVMPVEKKFSFQSPDEFEFKAKKEIKEWIPRLANKAFHVRMHRRGFKDRMRSVDEEQFLDHFIIQTLEAEGATASITFEDPDAVIALDTIGNDAGLSFWERDALARHPILRLD